jgi:hypothetical protein
MATIVRFGGANTGKIFAAATLLAGGLAAATPASGQLAVGTGWDLQDTAALYGGSGVQFTLSDPAYLEFTTLVGDITEFDFALLNSNYTGLEGGWVDLGTTEQGAFLDDTDPPDGGITRRTLTPHGLRRSPLISNT